MSEVVILGSGTGIPSLRRASPGLVLLSEDTKMLIDSGPGILRRMLEIGMTYRDIDLLLYTHLHPDHIADFVPFFLRVSMPTFRVTKIFPASAALDLKITSTSSRRYTAGGSNRDPTSSASGRFPKNHCFFAT